MTGAYISKELFEAMYCAEHAIHPIWRTGKYVFKNEAGEHGYNSVYMAMEMRKKAAAKEWEKRYGKAHQQTNVM